MNEFFWSDPHFWHRKVIASCNRPYASIEEMNEQFIINYNSVVGPKDLCYWTGDMFFCGKTLMKEILVRLNGERIWYLGNHDWKNIKIHRAAEFGCREIIKGFGQLDIAGRKVNIGHFPYRGGGDKTFEERYTTERIENDGNWLIHGHVHCAWKVREKMINVGVDVWDYKPAPLDEIVKIMGAV